MILEIIAYLSMILDHIGAILIRDNYLLRILGRAAFPIFVYFLSLGYSRTRNMKQYLWRIFFIGVISQIPWAHMFPRPGYIGLNMCATLFMILIIQILIEKKQYIYALAGIWASWAVCVEYGVYGIFTGLVYMRKDLRPYERVIILSGMTVLWALYTRHDLQVFAIPVFIIIEIMRKYKELLRIPQRLKYAIYPVHLLVLIFIKEIWYALS